ncbi:NtaA/DmoA family FMN-dependent monooxygenase [Bradyrhizobium canariense]|uniref:NtaA/DmoA family FMN-dependent monooxygenase n=1 Tax=Bradyrhizobium canariense TaxID=255045 RepID=UPI001CA5DD77|nr:NtaA/DmoA family FMN-dependent monooxygenase [Bradyrhizobium canariense]
MPSIEPELRLALNLHGAGGHAAAWRWPGNPPGAFYDIEHYVRAAKVAERGKLDAVFLADTPALNLAIDKHPPLNGIEPTITLASIARETKFVGLIGSASTTYNEPYNLARRFQSLDVVSGGRAAWNAVTTSNVYTAKSFGGSELSRDDRYCRAEEFVEAVRTLWHSWGEGALVLDQVSGRFGDPSRLQTTRHAGKFFDISGPLTHPGSRQGRPVIFQAGGSDQGLQFAARSADAVFSSTGNLEIALSEAERLRSFASQHGRRAPLILPGIVTFIGGTEEEAIERKVKLDNLINFDVALHSLAMRFGIPAERLKIDEPIHLNLLPRHADPVFSVGQHRTVEALVRSGKTVREIIVEAPAYGHRVLVGSPEQIAASLEEWFRVGAVDGFNVIPDVLSDGTPAFADHVVPVLQRRGLFRSDYRGETLREHLGIPL